MIENYKEQLKDRPKEELELLVDSHVSFPKEAVKAAIELLKEDHGVKKTLPFKGRKLRRYEKDEFTYQNYFKTFSYREITSALSLAFLFNAGLELLKYLREAPWINENFTLLALILAVAVFTVNHVIYKLEHKRRNFFLGRIMQNGLLLFAITFVMVLNNWLLGDGSLASRMSFSLIFGFFLFLLAIEIILSIFRRILTLFKWHIW